MAKIKQKRPDPDSEESQLRMTFGDHLEELRKRIIYALLGSAFGIVVCIYFSNEIVNFLLRPYIMALQEHFYVGVMSFSKPATIVLTYLSVGIKAGLIVSSPWIIHQIWLFIGAGLYKRERKIVYRYIGPSALLFLLGTAFFYILVLPASLNFFVAFTDNTALKNPEPYPFERALMHLGHNSLDPSKFPPGDKADLLKIPIVSSDIPAPPEGTGALFFNASDRMLKFRFGDHILQMMVVVQGSRFVNTPSFEEYLSFITIAGLIFGLAFELPMVIMILAQIGLVETQTFRNMRKYAYFGLAVLAAVAAPSPDPAMMIALMLPLALLYELGILLAAIVVRRQEKRDDDEE